jgi:putative ABC transport system permease protein
MDRGVLLFTIAVSLATGVLFGLAPAVHAARTDANSALKESGRGSSARHSTRTRQVLVVVEVALSLVLLASAGLLLRSVVALQHVDPGFVAEHVVTSELGLPKERYPDQPAQLAVYRRLLDALRAIPGAEASGLASTLPLSGNDLGVGFSLEGREQQPGNRPTAAYYAVSPDYFKTMGIRVTKGRVFTERDDENAPNVIVISETFARQYWPAEDPIGRRVTIGYNKTGPREIVGVVADVKHLAIAEHARPQMYTPFPQTPWPFLSAIVKARGDAAAAAASLRTAITSVDASQAVSDVKTVTDFVAASIATPRFTATLVGTFAATALLLAGFGVFSVIAYSVAQQRREIGIRVALGAQPADIRSLVVGQAFRLGVTGLVAGLAAALAAARVMASLLFGVSPADPATFGAVSAALLFVLLIAAYLPARRATRTDPMIALRTE